MTYEEIKRIITACQSSELDLSDCSLTDDDVVKMVSIINQQRNITSINFSYNNLSSGVFVSLLQLEYVTGLNLADNNICNIDQLLMASTKFSAINLRSNNIPSANIESFLKSNNALNRFARLGFEGNPGWPINNNKV